MLPEDISLIDAAEALKAAVVELAVTVFDCQPARADLVFIDDLMERVSELQAAVETIRAAMTAGPDGRLNAGGISAADAAADLAAVMYWRDLQGFRTGYELRRTAGRPPGWREWAAGVQKALDRCADPILNMRAAVRAAWRGNALSSTVRTPGGTDAHAQ